MVCILVKLPVPTFYKGSIKLCSCLGNRSSKTEAVNKATATPERLRSVPQKLSRPREKEKQSQYREFDFH